MGHARIKVAGLPATKAIRWMAAQGWDIFDIKKVLKQYNADVARNTITTQMAAAKKMGAPTIASYIQDILRKAKDGEMNGTNALPIPKVIQAAHSHECACCGVTIDIGEVITKREVTKDGKTFKAWCHPHCDRTAGTKSPSTSSDQKAKLDGLDALTELLDQRIRSLEAERDKLHKRITTLEKEQPPREIVLIKPNKQKKKIEEHVHPIFEQLMFHIQAGDNVMLVGPRGCGKTTICEQLAKTLELPYGFQSLSGGVTESKLFGRVTPDINTGKNVYHRALFVELFEEGGVFLLDEIDAADPNVLLSINSGLSVGQLALDRSKNPVAKRHKDFVCVAAANT